MHRCPRVLRWTLLVAAASLLSCARAERPDVLLVTIDTLRADRVGCYGYRDAWTPTLDRLAREGMMALYCQSPSPITLPSHATILTGRLPSQHGVRNNSTYRLPSSVPTLAEILREEGYATGAFVAALPLAARFGLDRGFDTYDDSLPASDRERFQFARRSAAQVVDAARQWIGQQPADQPVFVWVHFFEPHRPYSLLPELQEHFESRPYDGEVAAADLALTMLLASFDEARGSDRLTVVTSDHGEGLMDHGEPTHTLLLFETTQRVPLLMHWPEHLPAGFVVQEPVGLIDVAPTVLDLTGLDASRLDAEGIVLSPSRTMPRRDLMAETLNPLESYGWSPAFALRDGQHKVIRSAIDHAYDLEADAGEQSNLLRSDAPPEWAQSMLGRLTARIESMPAPPGDASREPTAAEVEALAALGYVAGAAPASSDPREFLDAMTRLPDATERMDEYRRTDEALELVAQGEFTQALEILQALVKDSPTNAKAWTMLGGALLERGDDEGAMAAFDEAATRQPQWLAPHVNLARLHMRAGHPEPALPHYYRALDLDPENIAWVRETVACLWALGQTDQAEKVLQDAADRGFDPASTSWIEGGLALLLFQRGDTDGGLRHVRAARGAKDDPQLALLETRILEQQGRGDEARANLERALTLYPDDPGLAAKAEEIGLR